MTTAVLFSALLISAEYPRAELLIEPTQLRAESDVILLDTRDSETYRAGHIPNALNINPAEWSKAFPAEPKADDWAKRLGDLGIDPKARVVIYADSDIRDAARIWWILRYWNVESARLLNGGWDAWKSSGGKVHTDICKPTPKSVRLTPRNDLLATKADLLTQLKGMPPQIIDARSEREYCGTMKTAKRAGAIPSSIHLEWKEALDPKTGKFKSPDELSRILKERGINPNEPAVTYCQSGGRAAVMAFTLELMGGKQVRNYYQSWSEWGNSDDTPIVQPKPKK